MSKLKNYISIIIMLALIAGLYFGAFQALMPLTGYLLGFKLEHFIQSIDHWIAFVLLAVIGGNMIKEALSKDEEEHDASFAFLGVDIVPAALLIGVTTFVISAAGVWVGNAFGSRYKSKAELVGGVVLILIGVKILLEHLGII